VGVVFDLLNHTSPLTAALFAHFIWCQLSYCETGHPQFFACYLAVWQGLLMAYYGEEHWDFSYTGTAKDD